MLDPAALRLALHQQFAVEHALGGESGGDIGKAAGDIVARAAVEPGLPAGMDELDADPVPFPLGGIVREIDLNVLQRMGEHEGAEDRRVGGGRPLAPALGPGEQRQIRGPQPVPDLLHLVDIEPERLRQPGLGQPRRYADAQRPGRELEQSEAPRRIELIEHRRQRARRLRAAERRQAIDHGRQAERAGIDFGRHPLRLGPEQGDGFGQIADEIAAHREQHRIDPFLDQRTDRRSLDPGQVEPAGERRHRPTTIGIGRRADIVGDQLQFGVARAGVDEPFE